MSPREHRLATSVLVLGTGVAGLCAAVELAQAGVAVTAAGLPGARHSPTAAATAPGGWERQAADTLAEGCLLADPRAVQLVARNTASALHAAERHGIRSDDPLRVLRERAAHLDIPVLPTLYVTRLLVDDGTVFGAYGFDTDDGSRILIHADAVILATGGHTRIWRRTSAGRHENTGDALRLAAGAGARIRDAELVQFHPAGLLEPAGRTIDENVWDTDAFLLNNRGERFLARYAPEHMEKSHPDLLLAACYTEIKQGRGTPSGGVWLDLSHLPRETVLARLPRAHRLLLDLRSLDISADPVEVAPTAYYAMGGVWVRPDDQSTDIEGLFVVGEAAAGLHGANPMALNTVVESFIHGRVAGRAAAEYSARLGLQRRSLAAVRDAEADLDGVLAAEGDHSARALQRAVRNLMTEHAGVVRDAQGLSAGLTGLAVIEDQMTDLGVYVDVGGHQELTDAFDLRSAVIAARVTLECALERRETRGAHQRSDYPDTDPALRVSMVWSPTTGVRREAIAPIPGHLAALIR